MKKRGKFIVIEGIDASGKNTQFKLLLNKLKSLNFKLLTANFPRYYSSTWGKLVGRFLTGEFGELDEVSPYLATLSYMVDQYTWSRDIGIPWIEKGGWILSNRYFTSNVHQIAKLKTRAQKKFREWLWPAGYKDLGILRPDLVIFINTTPGVSKLLIKTKREKAYLKGKREDIAEKHWGHQLAAYREYKKAVKMYDWWVGVSGVKSAKLDYSKAIHQEVWQVLNRKLLKKKIK